MIGKIMGSVGSKIKKMNSTTQPAATSAPAPTETAPVETDAPAVETAVTGRLITVFPPHNPPGIERKSVFLAGSIDMGTAIDWQADLTKALSDLEIKVYNPRRPNWDSTWTQEITFDPFRKQVEWELGNLERVDVIAMYLPEASKAPISLLELGLFASSGRLIVACPKKFWRQGNVEIVCKRYNVPLVETVEKLEELVRERLENPVPPAKPIDLKDLALIAKK